LLGREYSLSGRVVHGDGRGAGLGFATANVALPANLKLPMHGVYAVCAEVHGARHDAVANFGVRPTVANTHVPSLEVHLFDQSAMLYGASMTVHFVAMLRGERKFESLSALTAQIAEDCAAAKTALASQS
jgi:riboflavin kinase/FMN adenylyltransferase